MTSRTGGRSRSSRARNADHLFGRRPLRACSTDRETLRQFQVRPASRVRPREPSRGTPQSLGRCDGCSDGISQLASQLIHERIHADLHTAPSWVTAAETSDLDENFWRSVDSRRLGNRCMMRSDDLEDWHRMVGVRQLSNTIVVVDGGDYRLRSGHVRIARLSRRQLKRTRARHAADTKIALILRRAPCSSARATCQQRGRARRRAARCLSLYPRHPTRHVPGPAVDNAAVRRLRHGGRTNARYRICSSRCQGPECRVRPADTDGLRLRPSDGRRRSRPGRRGDRLDRRHGHALRRHPARPRLHIDDDQRDGHHPAGALRRRRAASGVRRSRAVGHDSERRPEGVRRARHVHLSARALPSHCRRTFLRGASRSCPTGTPSRSAGTTSARPARRPCRKSRSRWPTPIAYVDAARTAGLDVNRVGQRLSFFFAAHNDFIEEIAKFRAARRLWAHVMRDRFGATEPRAMQLRFHAQTAGSTLTAQQPDNNIVRVAIQALAAVLGGTQSLHCNGRDEALALPTEESARLALRTQQIIAAETGVTTPSIRSAAPGRSSTAPNEIESRRAALIAEIDAAGGAPSRRSRAGAFSGRSRSAAYAAQQRHRARREGHRRRQPLCDGWGTADPVASHRPRD